MMNISIDTLVNIFNVNLLFIILIIVIALLGIIQYINNNTIKYGKLLDINNISDDLKIIAIKNVMNDLKNTIDKLIETDKTEEGKNILNKMLIDVAKIEDFNKEQLINTFNYYYDINNTINEAHSVNYNIFKSTKSMLENEIKFLLR